MSFRRIGNHTIAHLMTPHSIVEASGAKARQVGWSGRFKLIWQLEGTMRFEERDRSFTVSSGEMLVTAVSRTYCLEMSENYAGLVLVVDPILNPAWQKMAHRAMERPMVVGGPLAAVAAGAAALLHHASSAADMPTIESLIEIAIRTLGVDSAYLSDQPLPAMLLRARLMLARSIGDEGYGPDSLAHDLGLSRRSLYNAFGRVGLTPAQFIKRQRLEHAKADLLKQPVISITPIALQNGFSDGTAFSHAFRAQYGISPRELRRSTSMAC
ncbi:MAG: helix-turn-helix domain-containing protein [Bradyrhizobium sp.]